MQAKEVRLGLCFFDNQLLYAVSSFLQKYQLKHIGAIDFNFNISRAFFERQKEHLSSLQKAVDNLKKRFNCTHLRVLLNPQSECWTVLPKLVYDSAEEREAHIKILMKGIERGHIHTSWRTLSNEKYKLLQMQTDGARRSIKAITNGSANIDLLSAFEIGEKWISHIRPGGSFLTVCCCTNCIAASSFILGKLRGTTYISFDHIENLPYLWLQQADTHSWMKGLHEQIQIYGSNTSEIIEILKPLWGDEGSVIKMNSLEKIKVTAEEKTYGFELERAYPAIIMAL